jgi:pyruvate,orthophosphate dikinase
MQGFDFAELFRQMAPRPVTIRLLDPPLHEFLPPLGEVNAELERATRANQFDKLKHCERLAERIRALAEVNPMMGHRGCRLSITYPEIIEMQVTAILEAAIQVAAEGHEVVPEIMVPLVATAEEMKWLRTRIDAVATEVFSKSGLSLPYCVGTMIELPRAALCAGSLAQYVDFVSFGTNDLTQMTFGFSRDDSSAFLDHYLEHGILATNPFVTIDQEGVGVLMRMAIGSLRVVNPEMKIGVCGEHAGDPLSIPFFVSLGVNYLSCSPARIPIAQLAAGQSPCYPARSQATFIDSLAVEQKAS